MGDLEQELSEVCGGLNQLHARLVDLVATALGQEGWAGDGIRSPEHWLVLRAGVSPSRARELVRVAARRAELPALLGAFAGGQLSFEQVATVARHAPARVEASVTELAVHATVPQLRRSLSRYAFAEPPDPTAGGGPDGDRPGVSTAPTASQRASEPAELSMTYDGLGRFSLQLDAPADLGALVEAALREARDALVQQGHPQVTWAAALDEVCQRSLANPPSPGRRDAFRVLVHLDTDGAWLGGRPALPDHLVDKLTCDGVLRPLWQTDGHPVNVGRAQRIVPERTRKLVEDRDRGCRFPGCASTAHVQVHHIITWADGGPTDTPNLVSLCPWHHDRLHAGDYTLRGNADDPHGLAFTDRRGNPIAVGPAFRPPPPPPLEGVGTSAGTGDRRTEPEHGQARTVPWGADPATDHGRPATGHAGIPNAPAYAGPTGEVLHTKWVQFTEVKADTLASDVA